MGNMYNKFTEFLMNNNEPIIRLTFSDVEEILGFKLKPYIYNNRVQWANTLQQSFPQTWMRTEYRTQNVDMKGQTVEFVKSEGMVQKGETKKKEKVEMRPKAPSIDIEVAVESIKSYYGETVKDRHGRYLSWCHCYNAFVNNRDFRDEKTVDYLSLHLAFYLASWGMYRPSSFLFQKDYKVHLPVVRILMEERYDVLVGIEAADLLKNESLNLLMEIGDRIRGAYAAELPSSPDSINNATDTLVTKILLGALGCIPAYDQYYVKALKESHISKGKYDKESVRAIAQYYIDNQDAFDNLRTMMSTGERDYPSMKLMDMCMWQIGVDLERDERR